ncbi:MAG: T9SS type A sorting domain-containing protein [Chitinophagales bacterium]|nr:T9SS type A sorting domain-containing protein [Chitinophagales bacterium]
MKKLYTILFSVIFLLSFSFSSFSQDVTSDSLSVVMSFDSTDNSTVSTQLNSIVIIDDDELLGLSINPNPYKLVTTIKMSVSTTLQVNLQLLDMMGNLITVIYTGELTAGDHTISYDGSNLNPGLYYLKLIGDNKWVTEQMIRL